MLMLMLFLAKGREVDLALRPIGGFLWDFGLDISLCSVAWGRASGACGAGWLPSWPCVMSCVARGVLPKLPLRRRMGMQCLWYRLLCRGWRWWVLPACCFVGLLSVVWTGRKDPRLNSQFCHRIALDLGSAPPVLGVQFPYSAMEGARLGDI